MSPKRAASNPDDPNLARALFRYGLVAPLLFTPPAPGELEPALRAIASQTYQIPGSTRTRVSVSTLRRYLRTYQHAGFEGLAPKTRVDTCPTSRASAGQGQVKAFPPAVVAKAIALREEQPARTTATPAPSLTCVAAGKRQAVRCVWWSNCSSAIRN